MKIVMITHEFPVDGAKHHGGIAAYTRNMSEIFVRHGHQVTVLVLSDVFDDSIMWNGIRAERIKTPGWIYSLKKILRCKAGEYIVGAYCIRKRLNQICREERPDIVHYANFKCVGLFRRRDLPTVIRMSSDNVLWREAHKEHYHLEETSQRVGRDDRLEIFTNRRADGIFAPSRLMAALTEKRTGKKVKVIETPAVPRSGKKTAEDLPKELQGKKYFLYFGSLSRMKGTHVIAGALKKFFAETEDVYFVFAGHDYGIRSGKKYESFAAYIKGLLGEEKERVMFLDYLQLEKLSVVIEGAMCCVFPSRIDNIPNTCLEAMLLERPVIGTRGASFDQLLENRVSGFLVPVDDVNALEDMMLEVYRMEEADRRTVGQRAKQRLELCSPEKIYQEVMHYYKEVILDHEKNTGKKFS